MERMTYTESEPVEELKRRVQELEGRLAAVEGRGREREERRGEAIVAARNLSKIYGEGRTRVVALSEVNLSIKKGEFVAVQGPSGSGKTTLLNMLGALDRPTRGRVIIDGIETTGVPERKLFRIRREKVGFIFQTYYLVPTLTALQNVLLPTMPLRANRDLRGSAEQLLELVGLRERMDHKPGELSGGEQQRVAIARALVLNPAIILADEPTGNLDSKTGAEIMDLMRRLNEEQKKTFIIVTHDAKIASGTERVFYLTDGRLYSGGGE